MWRVEHSERTTAEPDAVWRLWSDVDSWPTWDSNLQNARLDGPFAAGATGTLKPTGARTAAFTIGDALPGRAFVIDMRPPLACLRFEHELTPDIDANMGITHRVTLTGPLAPLCARIIGRGIANHLPEAVRTLARLAEQKAGA